MSWKASPVNCSHLDGLEENTGAYGGLLKVIPGSVDDSYVRLFASLD